MSSPCSGEILHIFSDPPLVAVLQHQVLLAVDEAVFQPVVQLGDAAGLVPLEVVLPGLLADDAAALTGGRFMEGTGRCRSTLGVCRWAAGGAALLDALLAPPFFDLVMIRESTQIMTINA